MDAASVRLVKTRWASQKHIGALTTDQFQLLKARTKEGLVTEQVFENLSQAYKLRYGGSVDEDEYEKDLQMILEEMQQGCVWLLARSARRAVHLFRRQLARPDHGQVQERVDAAVQHVALASAHRMRKTDPACRCRLSAPFHDAHGQGLFVNLGQTTELPNQR